MKENSQKELLRSLGGILIPGTGHKGHRSQDFPNNFKLCE